MLGNESEAYIGRSKSIHQSYEKEGVLLMGKSVEQENFGKFTFLDAIAPHVVFVCGSRGSGKSYSLGIMAEELTLKNPNVACVIIDPIGVFWSMKYANKDENELNDLVQWGLEPKGIEKTQIFMPQGIKEKLPKDTFDKRFSIRPSELTVDEWCLTFNLDRFSPGGLLLDKAIEKTREKHSNEFSLDDLISLIEKDKDLTSKDRGYKTDTRRSLISRFEAAKTWGVFSKDGTPLADICKEGYVSVIDISFLEENVASLVIGILARKILAARKLVTRKAAMSSYTVDETMGMDELLNSEIPPTWLFIDEAHTLIPSGTGKTAATDSLIEYVKQGRRPGCSLVFATQQPSAIDTRVLSQLDILLCHKLVFDEDLKAVMKRMPTLLPKEYERSRFIKTLPVGIALVGDRSESTSRAFCVKIRPRFSQHEGRETRTIELDEKISAAQLQEIVIAMIMKKLGEQGKLRLARVDSIIDTMKRRYNVELDPDKIISTVKQNDVEVLDGSLVMASQLQEQEQEAQEEVRQIEKAQVFTLNLTQERANKIAEKQRKKKSLGVFGKEEKLQSLELVYEPVYKIDFELNTGDGFVRELSMFVDSNYEIITRTSNGIKRTTDMEKIINLNDKKTKILTSLEKAQKTKGQLAKDTKLSSQVISRYLNELVELELIKASGEKGKEKYALTKKLDIPKAADAKEIISVKDLVSEQEPKAIKIEKAVVDEKTLSRIPELFGRAKVKQVERALLPVYKAAYSDGEKTRVYKFDGE